MPASDKIQADCVASGEPDQMSLLHIGDACIAIERLGCAGPVVVFEAGLGSDMCGWEEVARPLTAFARVVLYDRPGIGRSGPRRGIEVLLASTVADELLACLHAIDMPPPYLLVGHSLGGFYMQAFARTYPRQTAAVVLIDSASPLEPPRRVRLDGSAGTGVNHGRGGGWFRAKRCGNAGRPAFSASAAHCACCDRSRRHV
jgi:pimeloyl-ACP methyl ester carboxylesterase